MRIIDISAFIRIRCTECRNYAAFAYIDDSGEQPRIFDVRCRDHERSQDAQGNDCSVPRRDDH